MATVDNFSGPLTDLAIAEWLSRCEDAFDSWEDDNTPKKLTDKQKIHAAGKAIVKNTTTDKLLSWWTMNRKKLETATWDGFRDSVKEKALGSGWRLRSLKDLYTAVQGSQSLDDYFSSMENTKFVVSRGSKIPEISDFEFKCLLFFRATPHLASQVLKNDLRDLTFLDASVDDIKDYLRKYESGDPTIPSAVYPAATPSEMATAGMWVLSGAWGMDLGSPFSDMTASNFPATSKQVERVTKLTVWTNNDSSSPLIQGFDTQFSGGQTIRGPPSIYNGNVNQSIELGSDEFISQVQLSRRSDLQGISSIEVTTSKGRTLFAGGSSSDRTTFKPPLGWRIVGFHGTSITSSVYVGGSWRYPIPRLGCIYAPIN